jgi:predicted dehydrogenase
LTDSSQKPRVAVVGAGQFGRNHVRVVQQSDRAALAAVVDTDASRADEALRACGGTAPILNDVRELLGLADAAIVAVPTVLHAELGCALMEAGLDVLIEKPIAHSLDAARQLIDTATRTGRVLQVGHLERYNPAVLELEKAVTLPLFFEVHRMNLFSPRALDVDVILDLMIHDLDLVLHLAGDLPEDVRAAGVSILSEKTDIANVRLQFANGLIANLTASRVSTERVRKLRLFQPHEYVSLDYAKQAAVVYSVSEGRQVGFRQLPVVQAEPLALQFNAFLDAVSTRAEPKLSGEAARRTLEVALAIQAKIEDHARVVAAGIASIAIHILLTVVLGTLPKNVWQSEQRLERRQIVTRLYVPADITQKDPNKGKISKSFNEDSLVARERVQIPQSQPSRTQPAAKAPGNPAPPSPPPAAPAPLNGRPRNRRSPSRASAAASATPMPVESPESPRRIHRSPMQSAARRRERRADRPAASWSAIRSDPDPAVSAIS